MAKSEDNIITEGLHGKVGKTIVFRVVDGETIVSKSPTATTRPPSEKQLKQQEHFQEGIIYGRTVMVTPELRAQYETKVHDGKKVFKVAIADFLRAPKIKKVDVTGYTGMIGNTIKIRATDDFMVKNVIVSIHADDDSIYEEGAAVKAPNGIDWIYTVTVSHSVTEGDKIVVRVSDLPGNVTESNVTV